MFKVIEIDDKTYGQMTEMEKRFSKLEKAFAQNGRYSSTSRRFIVRVLLEAKAKRKEDPKDVLPRLKREADEQITKQFNDMMWEIAGKTQPKGAEMITFTPDEIVMTKDSDENWGIIEIPTKRKGKTRTFYRKAAMVKQSVLLEYAAEKSEKEKK